MITDRQAVVRKIIKFQIVIIMGVAGNMALMKTLDRGQVVQARLSVNESPFVPFSYVDLWLIRMYHLPLGQPDNRPNASRPSGDSNIGRPSDRDGYRRPTQPGDGSRTNIQSMSEFNY